MLSSAIYIPGSTVITIPGAGNETNAKKQDGMGFCIDDLQAYQNITKPRTIDEIKSIGDGINIEDTMNAVVRYENGAIMSYSLTAYSPREGFRVVFTGTKGRLELDVSETVYVNGAGEKEKEGAVNEKSIKIYPMFRAPYEVEIPTLEGGHGGGDPVLLNDIFGTPEEDPLKRAASHVDGAMSILTGIAANKSIATGLPVDIKTLVNFD
jgi:hypothetical protein